MKVFKRDGTVQEFDKEKIRNAVLKAYGQIDGKPTEADRAKASEIACAIEKLDKDMNVEEIQDLVEKKLMNSARKDVAKAYIIYRNDRNLAREYSTDFMKKIGEKLEASNVQNQNANVDERSFGGRKGEADSVLMKKYALDKCMSPWIRDNHLNNEIYQHDLDSWATGMHNCLTIPFDKLLKSGFNTRQTDVRPARSINTAMQLVAVIFQLQSLQQFGGVSASHIDWTMVPYVRMSFFKHWKDGMKYISGIDPTKTLEDWVAENHSIEDEYYKGNEKVYKYALDMTEKETYQAVEGMYHNLSEIRATYQK